MGGRFCPIIHSTNELGGILLLVGLPGTDDEDCERCVNRMWEKRGTEGSALDQLTWWVVLVAGPEGHRKEW